MEPQKVQNLGQRPKYGITPFKISGKISGINEVRNKRTGEIIFIHEITVPAADEWSHPTTYPVKATKHLGPVSSDIQIGIEIQTYRRSGYLNILLAAVA